MSAVHINVTEELYDYMLSVSLREAPILAELRAETAKDPRWQMQITPLEGQFLAFLVELTGARRVIDIGTFTGYSAIAMAMAMPEDGRLITMDISEEWTAIARRYWERAGLGHKIALTLGPAQRSLDALIEAGEAGTYDLVFIDAGNKLMYADYYEQALVLLRPGGLVLVDNVLFQGLVVPSVDAETIEREEFRNNVHGIRKVNRHLHHDPRVSLAMLPLGDGVTVARKR